MAEPEQLDEDLFADLYVGTAIPTSFFDEDDVFPTLPPDLLTWTASYDDGPSNDANHSGPPSKPPQAANTSEVDTQMTQNKPGQSLNTTYNQFNSASHPSQQPKEDAPRDYAQQAMGAHPMSETASIPAYHDSQQIPNRMNDQGFPATVGIKEDG